MINVSRKTLKQFVLVGDFIVNGKRYLFGAIDGFTQKIQLFILFYVEET